MRPSEHRLGVLFEISIVCHVFVFVVLADGWGFSLFGGCSGLSAVFSRVRGSSGFSLLLAFLRFGRGGWGSGCRGFSRVRGMGAPVFLLPVGVGVGCAWRARLLRFCAGVGCVCAPGSCLPVFWGVGVGCVCASGSFLGCGFRGWVGRPGSFWGWVCLVSWFVFAVVFGRVRGGVSGCFCFRSALPSSGLGGVGLGWGCFFSGCCARPGLVSGSGVGFVWRV